MSGTLKIGADTCEPVKCHLMPLTVDYEGSASVANYFETTVIKEEGRDTLEASFRGRPLKGLEVQLPAGYFGAIIKRENNTVISKVGEFNQIFYWKYDAEPFEGDPLPSSLNWFKVSSALHESSSESD